MPDENGEAGVPYDPENNDQADAVENGTKLVSKEVCGASGPETLAYSSGEILQARHSNCGFRYQVVNT